MNESTSDLVLKKLEKYELKSEGSGRYRCHRSWSLNLVSDSRGLSITIAEDGEHGAFSNHVSGETGSLYNLRDRLRIPPNGRCDLSDTKRAYKGLEDNARAHGVDQQVFMDAECGLWFLDDTTEDHIVSNRHMGKNAR